MRSQVDSGVGGARALWGAALGTGLALTLVAAPAGTTEWRETGRSDGIVVAERSVPGQRVPTFRGVGLVETDLATVLAVIQDVHRHTEWLENTTEARILGRESTSVHYIYHRTNVPWPLSDREVILRTEVDVVAPGRLVFVRFRSAADILPPLSGVVRITTLEGFYRLEALAPRRTSVEYHVDLEPAGRIPDWIQRRTTRTIPMTTLRGLRRQSAIVEGDGTPVLAAEVEGAVPPGAASGVVASEGDATSRALGRVPETAAADTHVRSR